MEPVHHLHSKGSYGFMNKYERTDCTKYVNERLRLKCKRKKYICKKKLNQKVRKEVKNMENYAAKQITLRQASGIHK